MIKQIFETLSMLWRGLLALLGFTAEVGQQVATVINSELTTLEKASAEWVEEAKKQRESSQETKHD